LGDAFSAKLDLNSVNLTVSAPATLEIWLSDTDFAIIPSPDGIGILASQIGGTIGGVANATIQSSSYVDLSNALYGTSTASVALGPYAVGAFSTGWVSKEFAYAGEEFSVTNKVEIAFQSSGTGSASFNLDTVVYTTPEPTSLAIWGFGASLVGLRFFRRRKERHSV
jgi:hypothetical protein